MEHESDKREKMNALVKELGFKQLRISPGIIKSHKRAGVAAAHLSALQTLSLPSAVFEDDCVILNKVISVDIPDDADALFLGHMGITANDPKNQKVTKEVNYWKVEGYDDIYKIYGILSGHGIIYLTQRYVESVIQTIIENGDSYTQQDVPVAELQKEFNVYAVGHPVVYQSGVYEGVTNKHITMY